MCDWNLIKKLAGVVVQETVDSRRLIGEFGADALIAGGIEKRG